MLENGVDDDVNQALVAMLDSRRPGDWDGEVRGLFVSSVN